MKTKRTFNQIFFLKDARTKDRQLGSVYLRITLNGVRTELTLHRHCKAVEWDSKAGRMIGRTEDARAFNAYLDTVQFRIYEIYRELIEEASLLDGPTIKARFLGEETDKPRMLLEIIDHHNKQFEELVGIDYSAGTLAHYKTARKSVEEFLQWKFKQSDINIKKLNFEFVNDYEFFLKSVHHCEHNTAMGHIKKLKKIVRQCVAKDWLDKDPFLSYKISTRETHRTSLTDNELKTMTDKILLIPRMQQVRDIFLFSCYTGLSYSDVAKLTSTDIATGIDGQKWVFIHRTKTDEPSRLPLLPHALEILERYANDPRTLQSGKLLPVISNQRMNSYLKELADVCGIQKELTFHCARHTFATTVTLTNGVPIETVSKMLGHRSLRTTQLYAKIVDRKVSDDMMVLRNKLSASKRSLKTKKGS